MAETATTTATNAVTATRSLHSVVVQSADILPGRSIGRPSRRHSCLSQQTGSAGGHPQNDTVSVGETYHVVVRRTFAVVLAVVVAVLSAGMLGEYEFRGLLVPVGAGVSVGYAVAATLGGTARWRGPVPGAVAALLAGSSLLAAGWIDSDEGVEAYPRRAIAAAVIGIVTAGTVAGRRARPAPAASTPATSLENSA